ncbi:uncharacterized protein CLUP02_10437 [Colletotrichum lupini]|uniref:Uncharacterized protein n=1 Tax=Colletotrichum lupini TaxID=145971 RepID=A0A9Q8SYB0_9PEZI|nr:uncharacterized protein CLUP02_10437 [Colletotrichum lupini]UQC84941.1 hypothetical protein CLUP02_10437 [Colletotrichum lupini]
MATTVLASSMSLSLSLVDPACFALDMKAEEELWIYQPASPGTSAQQAAKIGAAGVGLYSVLTLGTVPGIEHLRDRSDAVVYEVGTVKSLGRRRFELPHLATYTLSQPNIIDKMSNWKRESIRTRDGGRVESSQVVRFPLAPARVGVDDHLIRPPSDVTPLPPTVVRQTEREGVPTFIHVRLLFGNFGVCGDRGRHKYLATASKVIVEAYRSLSVDQNAAQLSLGFGEEVVGSVRWSVGLLAADYQRPAPT